MPGVHSGLQQDTKFADRQGPLVKSVNRGSGSFIRYKGVKTFGGTLFIETNDSARRVSRVIERRQTIGEKDLFEIIVL